MFKKIWEFLVGKKTVISLLLLEICRELQQIHPDMPYWDILIKVLYLTGGGGLLHKVIRSKPIRKLLTGG